MNNEIYEKNLQALEKKDKRLKKNVENENNKEDLHIIVDVAVFEDRKVLYVEKDGKQYQLDSLYDSEYVLDTWIEENQNKNYIKKYCMFGFGNGMYVRKILQDAGEEDTVIVYEPGIQIFRKVMEEFDISDLLLDDRLKLVIAEYGTRLLHIAFSEFITYSDLLALIYSDYMNYETLFMKERKFFYERLQHEYNAIGSTREVMERFQNLYYVNIVNNFPTFLESKSLEDLYYKLPQNIPAIIVASGPSLHYNVEELKRAKGKSFIIAADSAIRALLKHDIIPDMYISIDADKLRAHFADERIRNIPMACYLTSSSNAISASHAEKFFLNDENKHLQQFLDENQILLPKISSGGSVANAAFSLTQVLGFTTMILVGQDLAYTNNQTHSVETVRGARNTNVDELDTTLMIEGIDGKPIKSSQEFKLYLSWFETTIKDYPELTVIDATEGGAKIHGTRIQTLKEAIDENCKEKMDFSEILTTVTDFLSDDMKEKLKKYYADVPEQLEEIAGLAKKAIRDYEKMIQLTRANKYASGEIKRLLKHTSKLTSEIEAKPAVWYVNQRMQDVVNEVMADLYEVAQDEKQDIVKGCEKGIVYMKAILRETDIIIPHIRKKMSKW